MLPNPQETADLVTFTGEILIGKLHFLCSVVRTFFDRQRSVKSVCIPSFSGLHFLAFGPENL